MKIISTAILLACSHLLVQAQPDTTFYSVVNKTKITGRQKIWQTGNGQYHITFQYNDRGRGDSTETVLTTGANGLIKTFYTTGIDYYKNPYTEQFAVKGDSAAWEINGEKKSVKFNSQFYLYSSGGPAANGLLVKWLAQQGGKKMPVLPDGIFYTGEPVIKNMVLHGKRLTLKLFSLYADPSPTPGYIWMTDDMHFFGAGGSWSFIIKKGFETLVDSLVAMQETAGRPYFSQQLKSNSSPLAGHILFTHANVFQSASATVEKDLTVEVTNGKITAVYPAAKVAAKADTVIDCTGKFLMPGLWDMHCHYEKELGTEYLAGGVTHIRDMGNDKTLLGYKNEIAANNLAGPDITYLCGFIDKEDPFQGPTGTIVASLDEGLKAIEEYHRLGYQAIKLYSAIKPAWVAPMAALAHKLGMRLCGHIPAFMTAEQAIDSGYDEVTHMNFIFLNFLGDTVDTRTGRRFRLVGDNANKLDLQSPAVQSFIALMKNKHIALDPTMTVWQGMFDEFKGDTVNFLKPVTGWMPDAEKAGTVVQTPFGGDENKTSYRASFANMMKMLKLLYDNGILLVAGTDGGAANALHNELYLYNEAGIPAAEVLKIATYNAALDCRLQNTYGQVLPGREADFIIVDGDPTVNISDIRKIRHVIKNNRLYQPKQLLQSQGWKYYY